MLYSHQMTEADRHEISAWRYPGEYAIYNPRPSERQHGDGRSVDDPVNGCYSFTDGKRVIGYIRLIPKAREVFLGVGVAPDCCGRGYGREIVAEACATSETLFPDKPLYLEVRTWNKRAIRCYLAAGFRIDGEEFSRTTPIGKGEFYRMVKT